VISLEEPENEDENCTWIGTPSVFAPRLRKEAGVGVTNNQQAKVCWLHLSSTFPTFVATPAPYDYTLLKGKTCMRSRSVLLLAFLCTLVFLQTARAQQDTSSAKKAHKVVLKDGSEVIGTIEAEDSTQVEFKTISGVSMRIPRGQIKELERLSGEIAAGEYKRFDSNNTRLFFAPTARPLKQGQGYFSAYQIFFPFVAIGATDFLSLAGGVSLIPGLKEQIFYLAPKVTPLHLKNADISAGVLYINATGTDFSGLGIVYGVGTYGSHDAALTAGLGWGFAEGEVSNKPVLMLGGELRVSNSVKLLTENWFPPGTDIFLYSFGIRFFGESLAADLGFIGSSKG